MQYKIIQDPLDEQSFDKPIDRTVTDLLLDRSRGCSLDIIETQVEDHSGLIRVMSNLVYPTQFAFNQGPTNYNFLVLLSSPERIRTGRGLTYAIDNIFDEKKIYVLPEDMTRVWGQREKAENNLLFLGNADEVIEEFKNLGYTFLDAEFEYKRERVEIIKQMMRH